MASSVSKRARMVLLGSVALTLVVYTIPFGRTVGYPFLLFSTLVHEMGHGLTALLVGGRFDSFFMWADGSGVARFSHVDGRLARGLVAAGGLVAPALAGAALFAFGRRPTAARVCLCVLGFLLIMAELTVVRGWFGRVFVAAVAGCMLLVSLWCSRWAQPTVVFFAVQLSLSVFSRSDYLFTPVAHTAKGVRPSDVAYMAQALVLPYWFWGGLCALFSVAVLWAGLRHFCRA